MPGVRLYNPDANPSDQGVFSNIGVATAFGTYQAKARDAFVLYDGMTLCWLGDGYIWQLNPVNAGGTGRSGRSRLFSLANVTSMVAGLGKVWFVDTGELVYNWSSTTRTLTTTTDPSVTATQPILAFYNEDIYLIYDQAVAANPFMSKYGTGNWSTTYNTPAGLTTWQPACWKVYKNNLYIGGIGTTSAALKGIILKFDGSSVTTVNELELTDAPATDAYAVGCTSMAVHAGTLYYVNQGVVTGTTTSYIGTFDNSTWTDNAIDVGSELGIADARLGKIASYKNRLLLGVAEDSSQTAAILWGSQIGNPLASDYTALSSEIVYNGGVWDIITQ